MKDTKWSESTASKKYRCPFLGNVVKVRSVTGKIQFTNSHFILLNSLLFTMKRDIIELLNSSLACNILLAVRVARQNELQEKGLENRGLGELRVYWQETDVWKLSGCHSREVTNFARISAELHLVSSFSHL